MNKQTERYSCYATIIAAIVLYILTSILVAWRLATPSDGGRLALQAPQNLPGAVTITSPSLDEDGLQSGDYVIEVEGRSVSEWAKLLFDGHGPRQELATGQTLLYTIVRDGDTQVVPVRLGKYPLRRTVFNNLPYLLFLLTLQLPASWILAVRPYERGAQVLFLAASALVTFSLSWFAYMDLAAFTAAPLLYLYYRFVTTLTIMVMMASLLHFSILLPYISGKRTIAFRRVRIIYIAPLVYGISYVVLSYNSDTLVWIRRWESGLWLMLIAYITTALIMISLSYRMLEDAIIRRRVQIIAIAYILSTFLIVVIGWLPVWVTGQPWLGWNLLPLYSLPVVFSLGIAIIFYHLFDLRIVMQHTLVWSILTAGVIIIYIAIVGTLSIVFQVGENAVFSLIATGVIAVLFQPVRAWLQRIVNRLVYGERDNPYDVIMRLANRLEASLTPEIALETIVQTVGQALRLSYAAIELCQDADFIVAANFGDPEKAPQNIRSHFPLRYGGDLAGQLVVAPGKHQQALTTHDHRVIAALVVHAEGVIQAMRLTNDLHWTREKLIRAREEERRRLRRDLHDGLGPNLASLTLQLDAARNSLQTNPSRTDEILVSLKAQVKDAVIIVRSAVNNLRPPALDELGLVGALQEHARHFTTSGNIEITIDSPLLKELPAAVEGAAYAIVLEAMTNAVRHSQASQCRIALHCDENLDVQIFDNGHGFQPNDRRGVGTQSILERAAELGGECRIESSAEGTCIHASLPLRRFRIAEF